MNNLPREAYDRHIQAEKDKEACQKAHDSVRLAFKYIEGKYDEAIKALATSATIEELAWAELLAVSQKVQKESNNVT